MSSEGGESPVNLIGEFNLTGQKCAYIFSYDSCSASPSISNIQDANLMCSTLGDLGFEIMRDCSSDALVVDTQNDMDCDSPDDDDESDDSDMDIEGKNSASLGDKGQDEKQLHSNTNPVPEYNDCIIRNQKPKDLVDFVDNIARKKSDASCIVLYFIAPQVAYDVITEDNKALPLFTLWKKFKGVQCPKLFIIQANVAEDARVHSVLLNSEQDEKDCKFFTLPESANMLLAYLPNHSKGETSVAKILSEELCKPYDFNTIMTTVIGRLKSMNCKPSPKFSSTLIEQLYLKGGLSGQKKIELPRYSCRRKRVLVYAFLFGQFMDPELIDLGFLIKEDSKNLEDMFKNFEFELEFCVPNGCMTVKEFNGRLLQIVQDEKMSSCDCIMIILSSHGGSGILHAYDGCFSVDSVWRALSNCDKLVDKPKVLVIDACRGESHESPIKHVQRPFISKGSKKGSKKPVEKNWNDESCEMSDVLVAMASTNDMKSYGCLGGSTFLSSLCKIWKNHGGENFLTIMNTVMHKVAHTYIEDEDDETGLMIPVKQQVTFTSTLQKRLHLPEKDDA